MRCGVKVDVCGLQETRWTAKCARFVGARGRRYKFWWKVGDGTGDVGVMVKEELVEQVCEVRRRSDGVIVVVTVIGKVTVRMISVHAPQQDRIDDGKNRFHDDLEAELWQAG